MKRSLLFMLLAFAMAIPALSQNSILFPGIVHYTKKVYGAGNQTRSIGQDKRGILYFANDDGLLVFDGTYWKTYPLPNKSIVRSLVVVNDRIYTGGQQEIGYFFFNKQGGLAYQSLMPLIPTAENEFTDVWHVVSYGKDIFFQSNKRIFRFHDNKITAFKSINWSFLGTAHGMLIGQQYEKRLVKFKDGQWEPIKNNYVFSGNDSAIRSVTDFGASTVLITTLKAGVYQMNGETVTKFETTDLATISSKIIYWSVAIDTGLTAIATKLNGCYVINSKGEITQHLSKVQGLQTNNITTIFPDKEKNLWLGFDNGIDLVIHDNAIKHINPDRENKGPGYSAIIHKNQLYLGTALGLYTVPLVEPGNLHTVKEDFSMVKNSSGIVWALSVVNGQLIMGHNDGSYTINNNTASVLDRSTGFWSFQPFGIQGASSTVLGGTYNGVNMYHYTAGKFINPAIHTHFESAKFMVIADDNIWVAHPYKGLYKIYFDKTGKPQNKPYNDTRKILSAGHNHLFKIRNKITLVTGKGIYEYDKKLGDFTASTFFNSVFNNSTVSYLREDSLGNIWFIQDKRTGVIDVSNPQKPAVVYFTELDNVVLGNDEEFIYPINNNNIVVAGEEGFYHINYEQYKQSHPPVSVLIRSASAFYKTDSTLFGGYLQAGDTAGYADAYTLKNNISYKWNSLHFEFSSPIYGGTAEYSYRLRDFEKDWSAWGIKTEKAYTNLPAGQYVFEVRARDNSGNLSPVSTFSFSISPPWYKTLLAYFVYLLVLAAIIYLFYKRQQKKYLVQQRLKLKKQQEKFEEEQKQLQYQHQLELEKNEKEIFHLKNEKLEAEVQFKNTELASNTMNLLQKKELLNKIKEEVLELKDEPESEKKTRSIRRITKMINEQLEENDDWEKFAVYFDKVNNDFLKTLKENFPVLTATDLKLCAYLIINLSSKEIGNLLNISIRGVETSRYRLRKKLELPNEVSLFDFLVGISNKNREGTPHTDVPVNGHRSLELV
ncbi:MAG: triple tyrosine motif-containing protein [Bacteroidota bacterium]